MYSMIEEGNEAGNVSGHHLYAGGTIVNTVIISFTPGRNIFIIHFYDKLLNLCWVLSSISSSALTFNCLHTAFF